MNLKNPISSDGLSDKVSVIFRLGGNVAGYPGK